MQAERLTKQIPTQPEVNGNDHHSNVQVNGPSRPIPITPLLILHEILQSNFAHPHNGRGIMQTPMIDQYIVRGAQLQLPNLVTHVMGQYPYDIKTRLLQPNELPNVVYYYNDKGQLYLDSQGTHSNLEVTGVSAARSDDAAEHQRNPVQKQLNPPVVGYATCSAKMSLGR